MTFGDLFKQEDTFHSGNVLDKINKSKETIKELTQRLEEYSLSTSKKENEEKLKKAEN